MMMGTWWMLQSCVTRPKAAYSTLLGIAPEHYKLVASYWWRGPIGSGLHLDRDPQAQARVVPP
jgi:hypothetical protein